MTEATTETSMKAPIEGAPAAIDVRRNRRKLVMLFSIGFVPLILAWIIFFYFPALMPSGTTNEGELITPTVSATTFGLMSETDRWTVLVPAPSVCEEACLERFYLAHQVNTALGKDSERVHRVLLDLGASAGVLANLKAQHPGLAMVRVENSLFSKTLPRDDVIYLMDPLGNIFMFYETEKAGKPMLKDIKHLLKISKMG